MKLAGDLGTDGDRRGWFNGSISMSSGRGLLVSSTRLVRALSQVGISGKASSLTLNPVLDAAGLLGVSNRAIWAPRYVGGARGGGG